MKPQPEIEEGTAAFERFRAAAATIMKFPKSDLPPDPFGSRKRKQEQKQKKREARKG